MLSKEIEKLEILLDSKMSKSFMTKEHNMNICKGKQYHSYFS